MAEEEEEAAQTPHACKSLFEGLKVPELVSSGVVCDKIRTVQCEEEGGGANRCEPWEALASVFSGENVSVFYYITTSQRRRRRLVQTYFPCGQETGNGFCFFVISLSGQSSRHHQSLILILFSSTRLTCFIRC